MIVANFMDSSLKDLERKGVFSSVAEIYNPGKVYEKVIHFTPHLCDLTFSDVLSKENIFLVCHQASGISPVRILKAIWKVAQIFEKERVDIVRGRLPYLGSLIAGMAARLKHIPFVVSLGGDNRIGQKRSRSYHYNHRFLSYGMEALVLRMADAVIVPNRFTHDYVAGIIGRCSAEKKNVIIPWLCTPVPLVDPNEPETGHLIDSEALVVPIIGFLNRYKFSDVLFDALDGISDQEMGRAPVQFVFCGDGPLRETGEKRFRKRKLIHFLGWQPRPVVHALLRRAAFVLIPMSGFVLLEAASISTPVIASSVEWHSEIVENGRTGLLVDPYDPSSWKKAIIRFVSDLDSARKMGRQLNELFETKYSKARIIAAESFLYANLVKNSSVDKHPR